MNMYVNLGCGATFHPEWINIDMYPSDPVVIKYDFSRDIPLETDSCNVVYHSHVLEHIRYLTAKEFMSECYRVLKPGGIIRIAVPDLEKICLIYLDKLQLAIKGDEAAKQQYQWMMLELYDQVVRESSGGEMKKYLSQPSLQQEAFVYERVGQEAQSIIEYARIINLEINGKSSLNNRLRAVTSKKLMLFLLHSTKRFVRNLLHLPTRMLLGEEGMQALAVGTFRSSGEVHQWMYDRYSLSQLMMAVGFQDPIQQNAVSSLLENWQAFHLDNFPDGTVRKPDSLWMEAIKPHK